MQAKICWSINGDAHPDQCVMRDCGLIPIMVRVRITRASSTHATHLIRLSRFGATCVAFHLPNLFGDMKSRKNLVDISSSMGTRGLSDTLFFPVATMSYLCSALLLQIVARPIPNMPSRFVVQDLTSLASPIPFTTFPTGARCFVSAGGNRNTSSP